MIAAAYPEVAFHRPRAVGRKDEWLWESATKFCAKLDRYAERTGPRKSSFGASQASLYSFPVFTHQETTIAAPVIAASMPAARERPSEAMISNQCNGSTYGQRLPASKACRKRKPKTPAYRGVF